MLGKKILKPDLTIFVYCDENIRQARIQKRGKDSLDIALDNDEKRQAFISKFDTLLDPNKTIFVNNNTNLDKIIKNCFKQIKNYTKGLEQK